jgi:LL-diaminopimelate aminotransferase
MWLFARIGMAVGNKDMVGALTTVKSNIDSGIPQAIQYAAIEALSGDQACIAEHNTIYQRRRDQVLKTLSKIGLRARPPMASLYVWVRVPGSYSSLDFCTRLLDEISVVVTPGSGYGENGEGYIRISLTTPDDRLKEALSRMEGLAGSF